MMQDMSTPDDDVDLVRRRLLAAGGRYVAPAILLTLALDQKAYAQASCGPTTCPPESCAPKDNCSPARTGG